MVILAFDFHLATQWNLNKHKCLWLTVCELKRRHDKNRQKCFYIKGFPKGIGIDLSSYCNHHMSRPC